MRDLNRLQERMNRLFDEMQTRTSAPGLLESSESVGKDDAGLSRLPALDQRAIAAATLDCMSARIGDSRSAWTSGQVSHCNDTARQAGVSPGMSCSEFVDHILQAFGGRH